MRGKGLRLLTGEITKVQCVGFVADPDSDAVVIKDLGRQSVKESPTESTIEKSLTVGTYSNLFIVYEIRRQVWW